jgi:hypothetical protein
MILVVDVGNTKLKLLFFWGVSSCNILFCGWKLRKILNILKIFTNTKYLVVASVGNIGVFLEFEKR